MAAELLALLCRSGYSDIHKINSFEKPLANRVRHFNYLHSHITILLCYLLKRALACIWLIYDDIKIPHLKGEAYTGNSSYVPIYTNYIPTEFLINGIVSALLTVVNVICIFITAIIVLKIKEVAAPYTSSPDLRRYEVALICKFNLQYVLLAWNLEIERKKMQNAQQNLECVSVNDARIVNSNEKIFYLKCNLNKLMLI